MAISISEFTVSASNTNQWARVKTSAVGGDTKYGICVTNKSNPRYVFIDSNFCPSSTSGSVSIVELYANSEGGSGSGDPNDGTTVYDGVALVNMGPPTGSLSSNTAVYGAGSSSATKVANYVYNFTNKGYTDTKKMAIGGNKNRRVFAIRSWGSLSTDINEPNIAFIGDNSVLKYDGNSADYSVGCAGATRTTSANTWVSHTAGDGTKYYSITNTTSGVNKYAGITLTQYHTYRFTLHAHTEASYDGVAICKTNNTTSFYSLSASQLLSGNTSTGKCSGKERVTTFEYIPTTTESAYIYFKSNSSGIGPGDSISFADVMVEDLGDLRATQTAPTAANVTVEYGNTATASVSGGGGQGELQYRITSSSTGGWTEWTTNVPTLSEVIPAAFTIRYQARYAGNASYKPSPVSNVATLKVTPKKITKPTAKTDLIYNGSAQTGINNIPSEMYVTIEGNRNAIAVGNYSTTYTLISTTNYCWNDGTTSPVTVNWKITPRIISIRWGTTSWLYDGTAHSTVCNLGNIIAGDSCFVNLSGNSITNVGTTTVTATELSNSNYALPSNNTTTLTVTPRTVSLHWGTTSWLYDGTAHSTTCTAGNLVGSDTCTVTLSNNSITDVGTTTVTATALSNSNYRLPEAGDIQLSAKLTIHPCMYVKAGGGWVSIKYIYKKVNGSWVLQTTEATIRNLFSEAGRYLGRYNDGSGWKNLIDGMQKS